MKSYVYLILDYHITKTKRAKSEFAKYKRTLVKENYQKIIPNVYRKIIDIETTEDLKAYRKFLTDIQPQNAIGETTFIFDSTFLETVYSGRYQEIIDAKGDNDKIRKILDKELDELKSEWKN